MTPEQLDEIEKLAEAATPGPYQVASVYPAYGVFRVQVDEPSECVAMCAVSMNEDADEAHVERQEAHARNGANARAIASLLRYALPLVKALRAARSALDEREGDMHARIRAGYDKTVADMWRAHCAKIEKERDDLRAEVERLRDLIDTVIRNCMECYDKRECQACAWLREGTEEKR